MLTEAGYFPMHSGMRSELCKLVRPLRTQADLPAGRKILEPPGKRYRKGSQSN